MPKPPRELKVSEERGYVDDGSGPPEDTDVFSRKEGDAQPVRPSHLDARPRNAREERDDDPLKQLRRQAASKTPLPEPRKVPRWAGLAVGLATAGIVAFALVILAGVMLAGSFGDGGDAEPAPSTAPAVRRAPPEGPEQIQGVEVRRGLKQASEEDAPPPKPGDP